MLLVEEELARWREKTLLNKGGSQADQELGFCERSGNRTSL